MIEIQILESPDLAVISSFKFFKNQIYLGSKSKDLSISDPEILSTHILIEIPEKDLLIHPMQGVEYFLLNNKRSSTIKKVKKNDTIKIGSTLFKIINFEFEHKPTKKEILNQKMNELIETNSPLLPIIEKLSNMMK